LSSAGLLPEAFSMAATKYLAVLTPRD
jgi:hypothetical protein